MGNNSLLRYTSLILPGFLALLLMVGCREHSVPTPSANQYAVGFAVEKMGAATKLTVKNPWEKARHVQVDYHLLPRDSAIPEFLTNHKIIRTPIQRIVCLSTTHIAFIDMLGETDKITGLSGSRFVSHPGVLQRVEDGLIADVGYGQNLNFEAIISLQPDIVMVYGVDSEIIGFLNKFEDLGITAVLNAEYLESSPLGKAEWIKFVSEFFGKRTMADSIFSSVAGAYNALALSTAEQASKPRVMVGMPYRESWWVPGGQSYMARLVADAGGEYLGKDQPSHESYIISYEEALIWASQADVWLNTGTVRSASEMLDIDSRFEKFGVFSSGRIYNNNLHMSPGGGYDFWERGTMEPHLILSDLIAIFHNSRPDSLYYYLKIE